jgi:ABC-2 type transport system ATP-binding protein
MSAEAAFRLAGLGKRYGRRAWALRHCTLDLPQGRIIGLVGANGAGKSTLLQLAIGLLKPTEGEVRVFGQPLHMDQPSGLADVGFVAQDHPLYRGFTVAEMLHFGR